MRALPLVAVLAAGLPLLAAPPARADDNGAPPAQLSVSSNPSGAAVFVDGKPVGRAPLKRSMTADVHRVACGKGARQSGRTVDLRGRRSDSVHFTLPKLADAHKLVLNVNADGQPSFPGELPIEQDELFARLQAAKRDDKALRLYIAVDTKAKSEGVDAVFATAARAGLKDVATLPTTPK